MSLYLSMLTAVSGLHSTQKDISIAARNITNASNDDYTRKTAQVETKIIDGEGAGVTIGLAARQVDEALQREMRDTNADTAKYEIMENYLTQLEANFGRPGEETSLTSRLGKVRDAFQDLATKPEGRTQQMAVVQEAKLLVGDLHRLSEKIQDLRLQVDKAIDNSVDSVNNAVLNIAELNDSIQLQTNTEKSAADLMDQRDKFVNQIAEEMGVRVYTQDDGAIGVMTETSKFLLSSGPHSMSFSPAASMDPGVQYDPTTGGGLSGITLDSGGMPLDITTEVTNGTIGGLLELRDTRLVQAQNQLDEFAGRMAEAFQNYPLPTAPPAYTNVELLMDNSPPPGPPPPAAAPYSFTYPAAVPPNQLVGFAQRVMINPDLDANPWMIRDGTPTAPDPDGTATAPDPDGTAFLNGYEGDNRNLTAIIDLFEDNTLLFDDGVSTPNPFLGPRPELSAAQSLEGYTIEIINYQANESLDVQERLEFNEQFSEALQERFLDESGVNIDDELARMIQLETTYSASARVLSSIQKMFDQLFGIKQ